MTVCNLAGSYTHNCFHVRSWLENLLEIMIVKVRNLQSLPALRDLVFCNLLHICNVRAIPTNRVYRLYDNIVTCNNFLCVPPGAST